MVLDRIRLQMEHCAEQVEILRLSWPRLDYRSLAPVDPGRAAWPPRETAFVTSRTPPPGGNAPGARALRKSLSSFHPCRAVSVVRPAAPHERIRQHAFLVRGDDDQRRLAGDLDGFRDPSGVNSPEPRASRSPLGTSVSALSISSISTTQPFSGLASRSSVGTGDPLSRACFRASFQSNAPPEGAGSKESADGQALSELLDHVSPILTDVARVVVLPSVLGIDDWLDRRRDLGLREPHHRIEFPEQVPRFSPRVDDPRTAAA